jgi:hypothetical protein
MELDPQYKTQDGSAVRVWRDADKNNFLSEREGRAIFDEVIFVEVISPGSKGSTPVFEVERVFAAEAAQYNLPKTRKNAKYEQYVDIIEGFKRTEGGENPDGSMAGTPLSEWPALSRSMVASMREARIFTVEALANVPDEKLRVMGPGGRAWRDKALAFLDSSKDGAYASKLATDLENALADGADKDRQIAELSARMTALEALSQSNAKPAGKAKEEALPSIV